MKKNKIRRLTMAAMMGAIAFVLMFFSFSVPVLSPFAEFDFSALPELIGGFILGPVGAVEIIVIKLALKLVFKGSSSLMTGELSNLLLSLAYVLPAVIYYRRHRDKKGAVIGIILGSVISVLVSIITNVFIIIPAFMYLYGMDWAAIIDICANVNPWIESIPTFVAFSVVPVNVISRVVTSLITVLLYKHISKPLKKLILKEDK